jgi:hypothetical protein
MNFESADLASFIGLFEVWTVILLRFLHLSIDEREPPKGRSNERQDFGSLFGTSPWPSEIYMNCLDWVK